MRKYDDNIPSHYSNKFHYRSQSVLNVMEYDVQNSSHMKFSERQRILLKTIDLKIAGIQDILDFLECLICTRLPMKKWREDSYFTNAGKERVGINSLVLNNLS